MTMSEKIMSHKPWGLVMKEHHKWSKVPRSNMWKLFIANDVQLNHDTPF